MRYLGIEPRKPRLAVFDFTGCEGCELQLANKEETLTQFLSSVEVVQFREVSSAVGEDYEIALVEGSVSREDEVERLRAIRNRAQVLVAIGSCACFGGVNRLKNALDPAAVGREVYGDRPPSSGPVRALSEVVAVDLEIPGCPISKAEVERILQHLVWDVPFRFPVHPVCYECKQRFVTCCFLQGELCLGPVTRGGCDAPCPAAGQGCLGCRGPAAEPNLREFLDLAARHGFGAETVRAHLDFFGGFREELGP